MSLVSQFRRLGPALGLGVALAALPPAAGCASYGAFVRDPAHASCAACDPAAANPSSLDYRVVLVGDAGESLAGPEAAHRDANFERIAAAGIPGKTAVVFLGDNIYPTGLPLGGAGRAAAERTLARQLELVGPGALGIVVPGNHDWDKSGDEGLARVLAQAEFVRSHPATAGRVRFEPAGGCPGPTYLDLGHQVRLVFYDSEWLLRRNKPKTTSGCAWGRADAPTPYGSDPITNADVADRLRRVVAPDRTMILMAHHPMRTAGSHGGRHEWWRYLLLGYPLLRHQLVRSSQDTNAGNNRAMRDVVLDAMSAGHSAPIIHASGHEHGLQVFAASRAGRGGNGPGDALYLVSGSGSKAGPLGQTSETLFKHGTLGFMTLDFMTDGRILLRVVEPGTPNPVFFHWLRESGAAR